MTLHRTRRRGGFTFIELLVSIGIIALLVSLLAGGLYFAFARADQAKTQRELGGLASSLKQFQADFNIGTPPPSRLWLDESMTYSTAPTGFTPAQVTQLAADSKAYLTKVWPRLQFATPSNPTPPAIDWNSDGTPGNFNGILEGEECLVFFLGGANTRNPAGSGPPVFIGFSTDATNPMSSTTTGRKGPYYQFETPRMTPGPSMTFAVTAFPQFFMYKDPYGTPYAYFSSGKAPNGYDAYASLMPAGKQHDCFSLANFPPYASSGTAPVKFYNADTFQILSAGKDGKFGPGGVWTPQSGTAGTAPNGADDLSNFYDSRLGVTP